jgi:hypothetical protein
MEKFKKGDKVLPKEGFIPVDSEPRKGKCHVQIKEKVTLTVKRCSGRGDTCFVTFFEHSGLYDTGFFDLAID